MRRGNDERQVVKSARLLVASFATLRGIGVRAFVRMCVCV